MMYWLPKLHKRPYKARFIANSSSCTTAELSKLLTFCLTAIKAKVIKYCDIVYERSGKIMFWPIKSFGEVLSKLKDIGFQASNLSTYDFSTLYMTLPHNLIKEKLLGLIERTFYKKENKLYLACNDKKAFFTSVDHYRGYHLWSCQNVCDALLFLLDNIYIRFGQGLVSTIVKLKNLKKIDTFHNQHFKRTSHSPDNVLVQPVEKLIYDENSSVRFNTIKRLETELKWIKLLQSASPLGFKDNIYQKGNNSKMPDFDVFSLLVIRKRKRRSHGKRQTGNDKP